MANVLQHHIEFYPRPVSHAPSPFGFGFGLGVNAPSSSVSAGWPQSISGRANAGAFHPLTSAMNQLASSYRPTKRRHDVEDDAELIKHGDAHDESMDRSPTPERPRRGSPKKARVVNPTDSTKDLSTSKENRAPASSEEDDIDFGVLLASLPPQSLLPLLSSLLKAQPALKSVIIPLIPRPTLETAIQALSMSAKKLRDAFPYSNTPSFSPSTALALGRSDRQEPQLHSLPDNGGMRDSYILSRLRPHVTDFVSACMSYLPYFTSVPISSQTGSPTPASRQTHAVTIQSLHKDKFHPSETFIFLSAMTNQATSQPPLTQSLLLPLLLPRLIEEWRSWVDKVSDIVNHQGGMFGSETVRSWERGLNEMSEAKLFGESTELRRVRDRWVAKVGWLVGRTPQHPMDEL